MILKRVTTMFIKVTLLYISLYFFWHVHEFFNRKGSYSRGHYENYRLRGDPLFSYDMPVIKAFAFVCFSAHSARFFTLFTFLPVGVSWKILFCCPSCQFVSWVILTSWHLCFFFSSIPRFPGISFSLYLTVMSRYSLPTWIYVMRSPFPPPPPQGVPQRKEAMNFQGSRRRGEDVIAMVIDFLLSNAQLVLGVGGAAVLGIATLAVKRVSAFLLQVVSTTSFIGTHHPSVFEDIHYCKDLDLGTKKSAVKLWIPY